MVAAIVAGLAGAATSTDIGRHLLNQVQCIVSAAPCTGAAVDAAAPAAGPGTGTGDPDRRDTARDARGDRRDDARRGGGDTAQEPGAPGGGPAQDAIGTPVPGTSPIFPPTQPWQPVDGGAGAYDSTDPSVRNRATEVAAEAAANALAGTWPDASRNLLHFLGGSGEPLAQDVDAMLADIPEFAQTVGVEQTRLIQQAVATARADGATGPVTLPVSSAWQGFGYDATGLAYDNDNYFYALGGWQHSQTGYVTVYPPSTPGGQWTYSAEMITNIQDQYNWDGGKSTTIGPFQVTDEQLAELHRAGLAQEFTAYGRSDSRRLKGTAP